MAGVYLRLTVLVAPPLAPLISEELSLNQTQLGALTTLPVLMLALGALPGSLVISRLGPTLALVLSLVVVAIASTSRGMAPPVWLLFFQTMLMGLAIAVMQPAFPALVLRWCPGYVALGSAVYMNGMLVGEFVGGGLTLPLMMPLVDHDWRLALLYWSLPALPIAALVFMSGHLGVPRSKVVSEATVHWVPQFKHARIWHLGIVLGAASSGFFGTNAYLSTLLEAKGELALLPRFLLVFNGTQVIGSVAMVVLAKFLIGGRMPVIVMSWGILIGLLGVVLGNVEIALVAAVILGLCTCIQLILLVGLVPQITNVRDAAPLAAGMFAVGYLIAFIVPLLGGLAADSFANARVNFAPLLALTVIAILLSHRSPYIHND
jgi:CP family cyanate transporter-like MFS transporter